MAKIASKAVKVSAAIVCIWYMSSGTVMIDRTTVSFDRMISMLTIGGTAAISAAGSATRMSVSNGAMPTLIAASIWPRGTRGEAGAEDLGEIGRGIEAEAEDARRRRAEPEPDERPAGIEQEQLHQERRAADDLDEDCASASAAAGTAAGTRSAIAKPSTRPSTPPTLQQQIVTPKPLISEGR